MKELKYNYFRKLLKKSNAITWNFSKKYKKLRGLLNVKVFKSIKYYINLYIVYSYIYRICIVYFPLIIVYVSLYTIYGIRYTIFDIFVYRVHYSSSNLMSESSESGALSLSSASRHTDLMLCVVFMSFVAHFTAHSLKYEGDCEAEAQGRFILGWGLQTAGNATLYAFPLWSNGVTSNFICVNAWKYVCMGGRCVGHGGGHVPPPPDF